ncbi:MAG: hypothetical protein J6S67_18430 [Methanobrevibacter sp.]|nr:hypothetical protein [Methanobrevibacter sp.]
MSKYTTELRFICEQNAGLLESEGYNSIANIIANSREKIFDFNYPIFDEEYRSILETKIIKHYYLREICAETVGVWKHFLDTKMNEIMPYYNKLYESELIKFNPLYDIDLTTDHNKELNGTRNENGSFSENGNSETDSTTNDNSTVTNNGTDTLVDNNKNDHWDLYQDTPQGGLVGIRQENYLTNVRHITDDKTGSTATNTNNSTENRDRTVNGNTETNTNRNGNNTKNGTLKDIEDYIEHIQGKTGGVSYSKLLQEFRNTFLNIDVKIINDLSDLFFNLW